MAQHYHWRQTAVIIIIIFARALLKENWGALLIKAQRKN